MVSEDSYNNGPKDQKERNKKNTSIDQNKVYLHIEK